MHDGQGWVLHTSGLYFSECSRSCSNSSPWHNTDRDARVQNSWLQQSSFSDSANRPSLLQQQDDEPQSSYFHPQGQSCAQSGSLSAHRLLPGRHSNGATSQKASGRHDSSSTVCTGQVPGLLAPSDADKPVVCLAEDAAPKANVLAYGKGYVQLEGTTLRVIPHVQNLETCARHCDMDSQCTHWRRCAGAPALPPLLLLKPPL